MKTRPTLDQLNGLLVNERDFLSQNGVILNDSPPCIGKMIDYLGDDWWVKLVYFSNHETKQLKFINRDFVADTLWNECINKTKRLLK